MSPSKYFETLHCWFVISSLKATRFQSRVQYWGRLYSSQLLSEIMLLKYSCTWHWGNGLSCTSGVLAASRDFVLSGLLPGVKRGRATQLPHVPTWPAGQEHGVAASQREPAPQISISCVQKGMKAHSPVEQIFVIFEWQQMQKSSLNHCCAPLFVIYSGCYRWTVVTPATRRHSWREQVEDGSMWQKISSDLL